MAQDTNVPKVDFVFLKPGFEEEVIRKYEFEYLRLHQKSCLSFRFPRKLPVMVL